MCIICIIHHSWPLQSLELILTGHNKTAQSRAKESNLLCHVLGTFALSVADKQWAIAPRPGWILVVVSEEWNCACSYEHGLSQLMPTHKISFNYNDWLLPWWILTQVWSPVTCWHIIPLDPNNTWIDTCSGIPIPFQAPSNLQFRNVAQCFGNTQNQLPKPAKIPMMCIPIQLLPFPSRIR